MRMLNIIAQTVLLFTLLSITLSFTILPVRYHTYMGGYYITTTDQYIFFLIFTVIQTRGIRVVCMCNYPKITIFALFDEFPFVNPSELIYGWVELFSHHTYTCSHTIPDKILGVWTSTLSSLFIDFGWRMTIWWITPQKLLIPSLYLVCAYP
jgi:hypothetical protein